MQTRHNLTGRLSRLLTVSCLGLSCIALQARAQQMLETRVVDGEWSTETTSVEITEGRTSTLEIRLTNTEDENARLMLREVSRAEGFSITYAFGEVDITAAAQGVGWETAELEAGQSALVLATVSHPEGLPGDEGCLQLEATLSSAVEFEIDDGSTVPCQSYQASVTILGAAITYSGSYDMPVTAQIRVGNQTFQPWGDYTSPTAANVNDGNNPRTFVLPDTYDAGAAIWIRSKCWKKKKSSYSGSSDSHWTTYRSVDSSPETSRVYVLRDGDDVPDVEGYMDQDSLATFVQDYVEDDKMALGANQVIYLFEYTSSLSSSSADFQDLVVLVTLTPPTGGGEEPAEPEPPFTIYAVNENHTKLYYYKFGDDEEPFENIEGALAGFSGNPDVEAMSIADDGTFYLMDNRGTSKVYKILPDELDEDAQTSVGVTLVGDTGLTAGSSNNEITSFQFIDGTLYGIGKKSKKIYSISTEDGQVTQVGTLNVSGTFRCDGMTQGPDGTVYLIKSKGSNSQLWRFSSFPDGALSKVCTISGSKRIQAVAAHPNGTIYVTDKHTWYRIDLDTEDVTTISSHSSDIEAMDFHYHAEENPVPDGEEEEQEPETVTVAMTVIEYVSPFQADVLVACGDGDFVGGDVHGTDPSEQSVSTNVGPHQTAGYLIRIENDGEEAVPYILKEASRGHTKWIARYFDAAEGGTEITDDVQGDGWDAGTLAPGASVTVRLAVVPGAEETSLEVVLDALYEGDSYATDTVTITTTRSVRGTGSRLRVYKWFEK